MKKHFIFLSVCFFSSLLWLNAQTPTPPFITVPNTTPNFSNAAVDTYTRALDSIVLNNGAKYGFTSLGATNILNLSLGSNPYYVRPGYMGSGAHPDPGYCSNGVPTAGKPVAETSGDFQVSSTGAAVYNIPIVMSLGTAGMKPQISISYNSQAGTGVMGVGFSLNGLSCIKRIPKNIMHDNHYSDVTMNGNDVWTRWQPAI